MTRQRKFEAAEYFDNKNRRAAYVSAALESGDPDFVRDALLVVAKAKGMGRVAKEAGLNRVSLYKTLGKSGNPQFPTIMKVMRVCGLKLSARPASGRPKSPHPIPLAQLDRRKIGGIRAAEADA
jgi:probable addiction module antidote protein